ncbi:MAG: alpha-L-fucosidase [Bacteroidetes bacterium]|nr:alpha-L-fucosidase [Bacteroidota bacterium]
MKWYNHISILLLALLGQPSFSQTALPEQVLEVLHGSGLQLSRLAKSWDEGLPLGNGMLGALLWEKDGRLRFALDRADLWDLRPVPQLRRPEFSFQWVLEHVEQNDYRPVQEMFDVPYDREATPTKLPGAALEFVVPVGDAVESAELRLADAIATIVWKNAMRLETFVHATEPRGWFRFSNAPPGLRPAIVPPPYSVLHGEHTEGISGPEGNDLRRLNYPPPVIAQGPDSVVYTQQCADGIAYQVRVRWTYTAVAIMVGTWTITTNTPYPLSAEISSPLPVPDEKAYHEAYHSHAQWWEQYWSRSFLLVPDSILQRQWYLEQYKFGSAARRGAPPISLQAIWTADNGRLPPWKGDFHNDLNTQLSYWPCYSANHLEEGAGFLDWLWLCKPVSERYTRTFYGTSGLNVPGVATLNGDPMGGWIQYSFSPTVSCWLAQHFYLQWRYSMDRTFLQARAYPWLAATAQHLEEISLEGPDGYRKLPLSSSPEINDNRIDAWFRSTTNYDLALIHWLYEKTAELARESGRIEEAKRWEAARSAWPELAVASGTSALLVAPGVPLAESHRHFSHLMAIHPLGVLDWDRGERDRLIISASLYALEQTGTSLWCGYSYSWLGNMWARARNGAKAAEALRTFATCFCLPNSFHANGDQSGTGKSTFTYRPFTLEGNFAFAAGLQEMLLQSQNGTVHLFPAVPSVWPSASFTGFRAEGAFLVSATLAGGKVDSVHIIAERGGTLRLNNPFPDAPPIVQGRPVAPEQLQQPVITLEMEAGTGITFTRGSP